MGKLLENIDETKKSLEEKELTPELKRAENVDLITLPESIKGTNCANCKYINLKEEWCENKKVDQKVSPKMCCALWDAEGVKRAWEQ